MKNHYLEQNKMSYHDTHEIKEVLDNVQVRNVARLGQSIVYYEQKMDLCKQLDEKIRLALVNDIFAELRMAFGIKD